MTTGFRFNPFSGTFDLVTTKLSVPADIVSTFTPGSVIFAGTDVLAEDNSQLFWDDTNKRLGIGTATPEADLEVNGNILLGFNDSKLQVRLNDNVTIRNILELNIADDVIFGVYNAQDMNFKTFRNFNFLDNNESLYNARIGQGFGWLGLLNQVYWDVDGHVGITTDTPTAKLHIAASDGSANSAPLKLTSGTNLTSPEAGSIEFDGSILYYTNSVPTRIPLAAAGNYITALTGDVTASGPGSATATLATVNSNVGTFGSSTSIPSVTVNAKGLVTAASGNVVIAPAGTLSGTTLNATVVSSSLTSVGTIAIGVWSGTAVNETHGGTNQTSYTTGDVIYASASNTLSKRAIGSSGDVLTVSGGLPTWAPNTPTAFNSAIRLDVPNGFGSTNTSVMRFSNITVNQGTDMTLNQSASLGDSVTINTGGVYTVDFGLTNNLFAQNFQVVRNSISALTSSMGDCIIYLDSVGAGVQSLGSGTINLDPTDVIRAVSNAAGGSNSIRSFKISRVG